MKNLTLVFVLLALALSLGAADITITARNDAGTQVASETITTTNAMFAKLEEWRLKQFLADGVTLKYPTRGSLLRELLKAGVKSVLDVQPTAEMQAERDKRVAAEAAEKAAREAALQ